MSERSTKRDKYGHAYTNETIYDRGMTSKDGVHFEKHYFENGTSAYDGKFIDRLCELEDKIEQGKIVEFPCMVGDIVYWAVFDKGEGYAEVLCGCVRGVSVGRSGSTWFSVVYERGLTYEHTFENYWNKTVFADRETAEAKLREMEGDNDEQIY